MITKPHLHVLYEHGQHDLLPFGSSQIRLIQPLSHPYLQSIYKVTFGTEYFGQHVDAVIVDRLWRPRINLSMAKSLLRDIRGSKTKFIYTLDDNFLNLNLADLDFAASKEMLDVVKFFLESADGVIVTTDALKDQLSEYNPQIFVVPNVLDERLFPPDTIKIADKEKITIGYMGTNTHDSDLKMIIPVIQQAMQSYPGRIQFQVLGVTTKEETIRDLVALPAKVVSINPFFVTYDKFVPWFQGNIYWDIGLCPLLDTPFNRCKSDIKYLDYGAAGISGVYSRVPAYESTVQHLETGYLAENTVEAWVEGVRQLVEDVDLRRQIAVNARDYVISQRTIQASAGTMMGAINTILGQPEDLEFERYANTAYKKQAEGKKTPEHIKNNQKALQLNQANQTLFTRMVSLEQQVSQLQSNLAHQKGMTESLNAKVWEIYSSRAWKIIQVLWKLRLRLIPPGSKVEKILRFIRKILSKIRGMKGRNTSLISAQQNSTGVFVSVAPILIREKLKKRIDDIDIVICVHNALEDVRKCLISIEQYTLRPYNIIIVDDGSNEETQAYLNEFVRSRSFCSLLRNETAGGYTRAANRGLFASQADYIVLLNSDTLVGPEWLERLHAATTSQECIGVAGPLSNTASWQSIPKLSDDGDWASNPLPEGVTAENMSQLIALHSARLYPEVPLLNGFCMMIQRKLLDDIGYLDEENFGPGYGEEDDFNLRAAKAGWKLVVADDVYIYHAQSKSYSSERRHVLGKRALEKLHEKHGNEIIQKSVQFMNPNRVIEGIRARSEAIFEADDYLKKGRSEFSERKVLFVLPSSSAGGGANVVIDEARCMRLMGVDAQIFNFPDYQDGFRRSYPHLDIPTIYGNIADIGRVGKSFDAVIATYNPSVGWIKPLEQLSPVLGYYVQGFEPLMYKEGSEYAMRALDSYSLIKRIKCFTKTEWVKKMVFNNTGVRSEVIGASINTELFRPRDMRSFSEKPIRVVAMIRQGSPYRNPELTMSVLKRIKNEYGNNVQIQLFGSRDIRETEMNLPLDFAWEQYGLLSQFQVANLLSNADIFVDFSAHQAMGLTALEAMACGCAVIVPRNGGAVEFVSDGKNGLVVDTSTQVDCYNGLKLLVEDGELRKNIQISGIKDAPRYSPEAASYKILHCMFGSNH